MSDEVFVAAATTRQLTMRAAIRAIASPIEWPTAVISAAPLGRTAKQKQGGATAMKDRNAE
jgi:hypothetical protein